MPHALARMPHILPRTSHITITSHKPHNPDPDHDHGRRRYIPLGGVIQEAIIWWTMTTNKQQQQSY